MRFVHEQQPENYLDDYLNTHRAGFSEDQRDAVRAVGLERLGDKAYAVLDMDELNCMLVAATAVPTPSGTAWRKPTPSTRFPVPALEADVDGGLLAFWVTDSNYRQGPEVELVFRDENGKHFSTRKTTDWPEIEKRYPREFWPVQVGIAKKVADTPEPALVEAVVEWFDRCCVAVEEIGQDMLQAIEDGGGLAREYDLDEMAQTYYLLEPHSGGKYRDGDTITIDDFQLDGR